MEIKPPVSLQSWSHERRIAGFGEASVDAGEARRVLVGDYKAIGGALPHQGMAQVVAEDRMKRGLPLDDPNVMPKVSREEVIRAIGNRILRPRIDFTSPHATYKQQDFGWHGYEAETVEYKEKQPDGSTVKRTLPNHLRPTGFREKIAARRMDFAFRKSEIFARQSLAKRERFGVRELASIDPTKPAREQEWGLREREAKVKQRLPDRKLSLFDQYREFRADIGISYTRWRSDRKRAKFDAIASGNWRAKWWTI